MCVCSLELLDRSASTVVMWLRLYRFYCPVAPLPIQPRFYCSVRLWSSCVQQDDNLSNSMIFWHLDSRKSPFMHINDEIDNLSWKFNALSSIKPENQRFWQLLIKERSIKHFMSDCYMQVQDDFTPDEEQNLFKTSSIIV